MLGLFLDLGSTFTKAIAFDLEKEEIIGKAKVPSTVNIDVTIGVKSVLDEIYRQTGKKLEGFKIKRACSSAKGGLKIVAVGLVPDLTAEAAKRAALGAGGKVIKTYSFELNENDLREIEDLKPDLIILAGGTDGGNRYYPLINARKISEIPINIPIIYAGNRTISNEIEKIFEKSGKEIWLTENVMPEFGKLNISPVQNLIREIFISRLIHAKGLEKVKNFLEGVIMPTPLAVLKACESFSKIWGETILIDIGGATTDVCSIAHGRPTGIGVIWKGLPEPYVKRTVEGDLGVRVSALSLWEIVEEEKWKEFLGELNSYKEKVKFLSENTDFLPEKEEDFFLDYVLSYHAIRIAVERHCGYLEPLYTPMGVTYLQYGKDLTGVENLIGTGGPLIYNPYNISALKSALFDEKNPFVLKPKNPKIYLDKEYIFFAIGLLSEIFPEKAINILKKYVIKIDQY
ncbi:MAG: methylaspartate mutase accessory protein GlmL [Dictyoglomaceae bacterium]